MACYIGLTWHGLSTPLNKADLNFNSSDKSKRCNVAPLLECVEFCGYSRDKIVVFLYLAGGVHLFNDFTGCRNVSDVRFILSN